MKSFLLCLFVLLVLIACTMASEINEESSDLSLLETSADRAHGRNGMKRVKAEKRLTGAASQLTKSDAFCVICQFSVQRIHADLVQLAPGAFLQSGETASLPKSAAPSMFLETESDMSMAVEAEAEAEVDAEAAAEAELDAEAEGAPGAAGHRGGRRMRRRGGVNRFDHGGIITPRRYRGADILGSRPARVRFNHLNTPSPDPNREAARAAYRHLYQSVYASFENLCARRMPFAYLPYCKTMLKSYRYIAQGIHYGDRPEQICINGGFCDRRSYVRKTVHTLYKPERGDAYAKGK